MLDTIISALHCPGLQELAFKGLVLLLLINHSRRLKRVENVRSVKDFLNDE
jgi:hypothetical protein